MHVCSEAARIGCGEEAVPGSVLKEFSWKVFSPDIVHRFGALTVILSQAPLNLTQVYFSGEHGTIVDYKCGERKYLHAFLAV